MRTSIILMKSKFWVAQKEQQQNGSQNVVNVLLWCKYTTNYYQRRPAIKGNGIPDHKGLVGPCSVWYNPQTDLDVSRLVLGGLQNTEGNEINH